MAATWVTFSDGQCLFPWSMSIGYQMMGIKSPFENSKHIKALKN
jgi:hypothetical protein